MKVRIIWIVCVLAGLATFAMTALIFPMFPTDGAGDVSTYGGPIYAFEFARTAEDLIAVFGTEVDPQRLSRLDMMDRGNRWDFLFMGLYTLFGVLFGLGASRDYRWLGLTIMLVAVVVGLADLIETRSLLSITDQLRAGVSEPDGLRTLWWPVYAKFGGFSVMFAVIGVYLLRETQMIRKLAGCGLLFCALLIVPKLLFPMTLAWALSLSIGLAWVLMLTYATIRAVSGSIPLREPTL